MAGHSKQYDILQSYIPLHVLFIIIDVFLFLMFLDTTNIIMIMMIILFWIWSILSKLIWEVKTIAIGMISYNHVYKITYGAHNNENTLRHNIV